MPSVLWHCWLGGRKGIRPVKNLSNEVLAWFSVLGEVQTCISPGWCHCHSLSLAPVKSRLVLPFWYRLTRVDPDRGPLNGCVCVVMYLSCHCICIFELAISCSQRTITFVFYSKVVVRLPCRVTSQSNSRCCYIDLRLLCHGRAI